MYSVVLLMAVTTGGESAEFKGCRGCHGGCGCSSACHAGCARGHKARGHGCHRSCRSCYVSSCHGCYASSGHGCYGGSVAYRGCTAPMHHAAVSSGCTASMPAAAMPAGCTAPKAGGMVYSGSTHGSVVYGGVVYGPMTSSMPVVQTANEELKPNTALSSSEQVQLREMVAGIKDEAEKRQLESAYTRDTRAGRLATYEVFQKTQSGRDRANATATIIVTVPANATVKIDGTSTVSTSTIRRFESPRLIPGKTYSYTFVAEYQQEGRPMQVEKKVTFEAGKVVRCDMTESAVALASR